MHKKMLLVACVPRSGHCYITEALCALGLRAVRDDPTEECEVVVDGRRIPGMLLGNEYEYRHTFQMVRDPLKTIRSMGVLSDGLWNLVERTFLQERWDLQSQIKRNAQAWYLWNKKIEETANWRFRIEDFDDLVPEFFARLNLPTPNRRAFRKIPKGINHRYAPDVTWKMLKDADKYRAAQIAQLAREYGYFDAPKAKEFRKL